MTAAPMAASGAGPAKPTRPDAGAGAFWAIAEGVGNQALSLGLFMVLAHFISPADFGTVALAALLCEAIQLAIVDPIATTVVVNPHPDEADYSAAFWLALSASAILLVLILAASPLMAVLGGYPSLPGVLAWMSLMVLAQGFSRVPEAWLTRAMKFRTLALRRTAGALAGGVVGIAAAMGGAGEYALVAQQIVGALVATAALWALSPWRPRLRIPAGRWAGVVRKAWSLAPNSIATFLMNSLDVFAVGLLAGPSTGGIYAAAKRLRLAPQLVLVNTIGRVTLSQSAQTLQAGGDVGAVFVRSAVMATFLTLPLFAGAALLSEDLCALLLGRHWTGIAPIFAVMMLSCPLALLNNLFTNLFLIRSRTRALSLLKLAQVALFVLAILATAGRPAIATAWASMLPLALVVPAMGAISAAFTPYRRRDLLAGLLRPIGCVTVMAAVVLALSAEIAGWNGVLRILVLACAGALAYGAAALLLCRGPLRDGLAWAAARRRR
jgi:O-antigen/teichoic acid export membrane protein